MSFIDDAIEKLQAHALACVDTVIKSAPTYPTEDSSILPMAIAYISDGNAQADNSTTVRMLLNIRVEVHFDMSLLKLTCMQIDKFIPEYIKRLCGDPRLGNTISTINFPLEFTVQPAEYNKISTLMVMFRIPIKITDNFGSSIITENSDYIVTEG